MRQSEDILAPYRIPGRLAIITWWCWFRVLLLVASLDPELLHLRELTDWNSIWSRCLLTLSHLPSQVLKELEQRTEQKTPRKKGRRLKEDTAVTEDFGSDELNRFSFIILINDLF